MSELVLIPDHPDRAAAALTTFDRARRPRLVALARAIGAGVQLLEEFAFEIALAIYDVDGATGAHLTNLGKLFDEPRGGLSDTDLRRFVKARILVNVSAGRTDELINIFSILTQPATVREYSHYPAGLRLTAYRNEPLSDRLRSRIRRTMEDVKGGGIGLSLTETRLDAFQFGPDGEPLSTGTFSRSF